MIYAYPHLGEHYSFKEGDIQIIVITREHYDYNFQPLLELNFNDVTQETLTNKAVIIGKRHVNKIIEKIPEIEKAHLVFVCCDINIKSLSLAVDFTG